MAGRPKRKADFALLDQTGEARIFDEIASGSSLRDLCKAHNVSLGNLHAWVSSAERAERYAAARVERASAHATRIEQIADDVENGTIQPDVARVSIDARKWLASKLDAKSYGDQKGVAVNISLTSLHVDSLRRINPDVVDVVDKSE